MVKKGAPEVDVIIPVHGRFDLLKDCLAALPEGMGDYAYRVFLVDDKSPEPLKDVYESLIGEQDVRLLINDERRGFPFSSNRAARIGVSPFVLFLNSDCIMQKDCGKILVDTLKMDSTYGVAGPLLLFPSNTTGIRPANKVQHAGVAFDLNGTPLHVFVGWSPDNPKVKHVREMQALTGACLVIKRDVLNAVGELIHKYDKKFQKGMLFQEDYGLGTYDDLDACFTVRTLGFKVMFIPDAVGIHYTGASSVGSNTPFPLQRNEMIFRARWGHAIIWDEHLFV